MRCRRRMSACNAGRDAIKGDDCKHNAAALRRLFDGETGAYRDIVALNAGAALVVAGKAGDLREGVSMATTAIDNGAAKAKLAKLIAVSQAAAARQSWM